MVPVNDFLSTLKLNGNRLKPQRVAICKVLSEFNLHPTAAMIYEQAKPEYPSLSLMTVNNTLNTLENLGMVNELGDVGDDQLHYDGNIAPCFYLACISYHKIVDIISPQITNSDNEIIML